MIQPDDGRWHPGIGDASLLGWVTVAAYVAMAIWAWWTWRRAQASIKRGLHAKSDQRGFSLRAFKAPHHFWLGIALILGFLAVNKQLDLQSWLTELARDHAQEHGWYERRHEMQTLFIIVVAATLLVVSAVAAYLLWPLDGPRATALAGLIMLSYFIVVRASSFHAVDAMLSRSAFGMRLNGWMELGGIALIALGAWWQHRRQKSNAMMERL
jgi:hypothetical protein